MAEDAIATIRRELSRLAADSDRGRRPEAVLVYDRGDGQVRLESPSDPDFVWVGPAQQVAERLTWIEDAAGPDAIRLEFARTMPASSASANF